MRTLRKLIFKFIVDGEVLRVPILGIRSQAPSPNSETKKLFNFAQSHNLYQFRRELYKKSSWDKSRGCRRDPNPLIFHRHVVWSGRASIT